MNNQQHDSGQMEPFDWLSKILVTIAIVCVITLIKIVSIFNKIIIVVNLEEYER